MNLLTSREAMAKRLELKEKEKISFLANPSRQEGDAAISSGNLMRYSVSSFINYLNQYAVDIFFYEDHASQFDETDYEQFVRKVVKAMIDSRENKKKREELLLRKNQESIQRMNNRHNVYEKRVVNLVVNPSRYVEGTSKRRSLRHRSISTRHVTQQLAMSTAPKHVVLDRVRTQQHISCERFWKVADTIYRRALPKVAEIIENLPLEEPQRESRIPARPLLAEWKSCNQRNNEREVRWV